MIDEHTLLKIIEKHGLKTSNRNRSLVWKRAAVFNFLHSRGYGYSIIGRMLGKDHGTMIHMRKLYEIQSSYQDFRDFVAPIEYELRSCLIETEELPENMNIHHVYSQLKLIGKMSDRLIKYIKKHEQEN